MICKKIESCGKKYNHPKKTLIDFKGGKSSFRIENNSNLTYNIIDFENYVYQNREEDTKCDYGLETDSTIYFIELKGNDLEKGCNQLRATINETKKCFKNKNIKARLVVSKVKKPKLFRNTSNYKQLVKAVGNAKNIVIGSQILKQII